MIAQNFPFSRRTTFDLATSDKILRKILETTREGILVVGRDTRIIAANGAALAAFGRNDTALENMRLSEVIRDASLHDGFRKATDLAEPSIHRLELFGTHKRTYNVQVAPIELGGSNGAIGFFYDVTPIERLEVFRQEFLTNISHELRTPLTSILAFVETLEDGAVDDPENNRRFLGIIRRNAERMGSLISDILELSQIEYGTVSIEKRPVRLSRLVDDIFVDLSKAAAVREIGLINAIDSENEVLADSVRLGQMLTNLIDNAIKFNRTDGTVTVNHLPQSKGDVITVEDSGEGISAIHLQRVFERFYRIDRARSQEVAGTGLGLAIVKHLAKLHGGKVSARSVPGSGTTFSIVLPKVQS
ncbi:MAG: ATP-binding protein [Pyrinomonadaceae bacterium]